MSICWGPKAKGPIVPFLKLIVDLQADLVIVG